MHPSRTRRNGLREAVTWFGALDHATGCRVDAETVPLRAYVTGGASNDAREAPCVRATTSRHVVWASSRLATHERREDLRAARTACRRRSLGGARMKAGDSCDVLQAPRRLRRQRSEQRGRDGPRRLMGTRGRNIESAHGHRAAPATLRLHLDVPILRQAQDRDVAKDALASATEATKPRCLVSLEEPGVHIKREHLVVPLGISPDRPPRGRLSLTYTAVKDGNDLSDRLGDGPCCTCPASCDARAVSRAHPRALLPPDTP